VEKVQVGHALQYYAVPGRGHCDLGEEMAALYEKCIIKAIEK